MSDMKISDLIATVRRMYMPTSDLCRLADAYELMVESEANCRHTLDALDDERAVLRTLCQVLTDRLQSIHQRNRLPVVALLASLIRSERLDPGALRLAEVRACADAILERLDGPS